MLNIKKIEKLGLGDSISLKCKIVRPQLRFMQKNVFTEMEEMEINDRNITYFFIDICISDLEEDKDTRIGFIKGCYILPEEFMNDCYFFDVCDAESDELEKMADSLIDNNLDLNEKYANETDCICYVSDLYIYKKYRNCGIGSYVLNELQDILYYYARDVITKVVLLPQPRVINNQRQLQNLSDKNENCEILKERLREFYDDNGFRKIADSEYMIKSY